MNIGPNFKKYLLVTSALFFRLSTEAYENPISKISIDSGYFTDSARAFWQFGQDVDGVVATGFDALNSTFLGDYILTRLLTGGVFLWQWNRLEYGFFVSNHEIGHGARFAAFHGDPVYRWGEEAIQNDIFSFWAKGFTRYGSGASATSLSPITTEFTPPDYLILLGGSGMNNSSLYAEFIEDQIAFGGGGHILQFPGYVRAKEDGATYVDNTNGGQEGDVANILTEYSNKGYSVTAADIKTGSLVSRWLSSSHWLFLVGAFKYVIKNDPLVQPFYFGSLRLPDFSHFVTNRGLSYKIRTSIIGSNVNYPLSLEYVYKGSQAIEASMGYRIGTSHSGGKKAGVMASLNNQLGFGLSGEVSLLNSKQLEFAVGSSFYTRNSIEGERLIGRYLSGTSAGYEVWGRLSYNY